MDKAMRGSQCIMNLGVNSLCSNLGYLEDGYHVTSDDCEDVLTELFKNLQVENPVHRSYRRQLCFSRVVDLDVIPLIKFVKDQPSVFFAAIRFLASLLQPVECLTVGMPSDIALPWLSDVKRMLINTRKLCTDKEFISAVTTEMKTVLEDHDGQSMDEDMCDFINKCLLLFRNLLYIQDIDNQQNQDTLVLYLLECDIGDVINQLVMAPQREYWCASIIQLVSLMYTRQTLEILKPLLSLDSFDEDSTFDDGEGEDSLMYLNCTLCEEESVDSTSNSLTGLFGKTLKVREGANEDCNQMMKDSSEMEFIVGQSQEEEKIDYFRSLLLKFTRNFIDDCFGFLVHDLKNVLLSDMKEYLDDTYFLWAMAFFLKIARKENLPFKVIRLVMTSDLFGFLVYEGVVLSEQLLIAQKKKRDPTKCARRLHLTINAIKESLKTLSTYSTDERLDDYDREYLIGLQKDLANVSELRMVFILLIRQFNSNTSLCFLEDLIITNHKFLELVDSWNKNGWIKNNFNMLEHIKLYGTRTIMGFYGTLLENFESNSCQVNKCIFTMMHHVAGDCQKPEVLMQMHIIQALMEVDGTKNHLTKEMNDLTEFLLNRFANLAKNDPYTAAIELYGMSEEESSEGNETCTHSTDSAEIEDMLFTWYTELQNENDLVDQMVDRFADVGITVNEKEVWSRLHASGLISDSEYSENKKFLSDNEKNINASCDVKEKDVVRWCVDALKEKNQEENLKWLQSLLCETAYIKLGKQCDRNLLEEPVTMYHVLRGSSVPVVLYEEDQEALLTDQHFNTLLHYLGFHTPQDVDMVFPRIPSFWTSEQLIKQAEKIGPLSKDILKFDPTSVKYYSFTNSKEDIKSRDFKEISHDQTVPRNVENNIHWLKQIQYFNDSQQLLAK